MCTYRQRNYDRSPCMPVCFHKEITLAQNRVFVRLQCTKNGLLPLPGAVNHNKYFKHENKKIALFGFCRSLDFFSD